MTEEEWLAYQDYTEEPLFYEMEGIRFFTGRNDQRVFCKAGRGKASRHGMAVLYL